MKYKRKKMYKNIKEELEAVKEDEYAVQFIQNPSEQVQLEAVKQNGFSIRYLHNPSEQVIEYVKENNSDIFNNYFEDVKNETK